MYKPVISALLLLALTSWTSAETLVVTADRMFDAESGKVSDRALHRAKVSWVTSCASSRRPSIR